MNEKTFIFFPYFLTNVGAIFFFATWCFLAKDAYLQPYLRATFYTHSWLFLILLFFSLPRYFIKGTIPEPFKKGVRQGIWFIAKIMLTWMVCFYLLTIYRPHDRLLPLYQMSLWYCFFFTIYCHYRWGKSAKKRIV